jgi:hypothetical protein
MLFFVLDTVFIFTRISCAGESRESEAQSSNAFNAVNPAACKLTPCHALSSRQGAQALAQCLAGYAEK